MDVFCTQSIARNSLFPCCKQLVAKLSNIPKSASSFPHFQSGTVRKQFAKLWSKFSSWVDRGGSHLHARISNCLQNKIQQTMEKSFLLRRFCIVPWWCTSPQSETKKIRRMRANSHVRDTFVLPFSVATTYLGVWGACSVVATAKATPTTTAVCVCVLFIDLLIPHTCASSMYGFAFHLKFDATTNVYNEYECDNRSSLCVCVHLNSDSPDQTD